MEPATGGLMCKHCRVPNGGHTVGCDREFGRNSRGGYHLDMAAIGRAAKVLDDQPVPTLGRILIGMNNNEPVENPFDKLAIEHFEDVVLDSGGRKDDSGKPFAISFAPVKALIEVHKVFAFGAKKYTARGYTEVNMGEERYIDAAHRHLLQYLDGEKLDPQSGLHHLAHACCSLLIAMWHGGVK